VPKPAFHAVAHLQQTLGDFRLARVVRESQEEGYIFEWAQGSEPSRRVTTVWNPTGEERDITLPLDVSKVSRAERMPLKAGVAEEVAVRAGAEKNAIVAAGERPIYIFWSAP
jgi:hypothetical protein